ncbi:MAG: ATP-binding cassette domain-containing protein, partial [Planctomycetota bacterium]|nr:ATP-binding cassette domain-containing protein [Planctomycetota bacterium]
MSDKPIFAVERLTKSYQSKKPVLKEISLVFLEGAKIGVIGQNGAGKSTLLRIMAGVEKEYDGVARLADNRTVGFVPQEPKLIEDLTVRGNVEQAVAPIRMLLRQHEELSMKLGEEMSPKEMDKVMGDLERLQHEIEAKDAWEIDRYVETAMTKLHLPAGDKMVNACSGGERRRVALCRTLLEHPDLLLLDEPTNHLDVDTIRWLEETLHDYKGTVVIITHDRFFLDNVVGWMLEIWHGKAIPYQGNYSEYLIQRSKRMGMQEQSEQKRAKFLDRELEWIRMNPKARTTKNKARLNNYDKMLLQEVEERDDTVELHIPAGKRLGDTVIRFEKVNFAYDKEHNVVENLS